MSVSGKKEFDVKQILRLRWRWFSHPSQGSAGTGGCLQQEGYEHRGSPVHSRLKSHSRDRNGLKKNNSPAHNILTPVPGPTPVHQRAIQAWQQQDLIEHLQTREGSPKGGAHEQPRAKEDLGKSTQELHLVTDENTDVPTER